MKLLSLACVLGAGAVSHPQVDAATGEARISPSATAVLEAVGLDFALEAPEGRLKPGLRVASVAAHSCADLAGLEQGDVLLRADERVLGSPEELARGLRTHSREGVQIEFFRLTPRGWQAGTARLPPAARSSSEIPTASEVVAVATGLTFAVWESKLRRRLVSTDTPYGFKISRVAEGSPAAQLGLGRGDLLMTWDAKPVRSIEELAAWIASGDPGAAALIEIARRRRDVGLFSRDPWERISLRLMLAPEAEQHR